MSTVFFDRVTHIFVYSVLFSLMTVGVEGYCLTWSHFLGRVIGQSQRPLPAQHTDFTKNKYDAPSGIRTRNPNKRAATGPQLGRYCYWYRRVGKICLE